MRSIFRCAFSAVASLFLTLLTAAQPQTKPEPVAGPRDQRLQALVDDAVRQTLEKFADKKLKSDQLAVTLVDLRDPQQPVKASYRGDAQIYPASVIKLFYLVAAHQWME